MVMIPTHGHNRIFGYTDNMQIVSVRTIRVGGGIVWSAKFNNNGNRFLTVSDTTAQIRDGASANVLCKLDKYKTVVADGMYSTDGKYVITVYSDKMTLWDTETHKKIMDVKFQQYDGHVSTVAISSMYFALNRENHIRVYSLFSKQLLGEWEAHDITVSSLEFFNDEFLISGDCYSNVKVWHWYDFTRESPRPIYHLDLKIHVPCLTATRPDNANQIAVGNHRGYVHIVDLERNETRRVETGGTVSALAYSHSSRYLAVGMWDTSFLFILETDTYTKVCEYNCKKDVRSVDFSSDDTKLIVATDGGTIVILTIAD